MYKIVKCYYDAGIYTAEDVTKFVKAGKITKDEYRTITGEDYITE